MYVPGGECCSVHTIIPLRLLAQSGEESFARRDIRRNTGLSKGSSCTFHAVCGVSKSANTVHSQGWDEESGAVMMQQMQQ